MNESSPTTWSPAQGIAPIRVDFNDMPAWGIVGLNVRTTREELADRDVVLQPGLLLNVWDADADDKGNRDDLIASGEVFAGDHPDEWFLKLDGPVRSHSDDRA